MAICNTGWALRMQLYAASTRITDPNYPLSEAQLAMIDEERANRKYQRALGNLLSHQRTCRYCAKLEGKTFEEEWHER